MGHELAVGLDKIRTVWVSEDGGDPEPVDHVEDWAMRFDPTRYERIRVVASRQNHRLLLALHERQTVLETSVPVRVGAPGFERDSSVATLKSIRVSDDTQRRFGLWHTWCAGEYPVYQLYVSSVGDSEAWIRQHPVWPALSFLTVLDVEIASVVLARIGDPRWFIHPTKVGRLSPLAHYLALDGKHFQALFSTETRPSRCRDFVQMWGGIPANRLVEMDDPRNFLFRDFAAGGRRWEALRRASRRLLRFMVEIWLQQLTGSQNRRFEPELFFNSKSETEAFSRHLSKLRDQFDPNDQPD